MQKTSSIICSAIGNKGHRGKTLLALFILLLTLSVVFGESAQQATLEQKTAPAVASISVVKSSPDLLIRSLLFERVQKPCWIRLAENQRQSHSTVRAVYTTPLNIISSYKSARQDGQTEPEIPVLFSKSLQSNSPPGLIQRL